MITRYVLTLEAVSEHPLYADSAYRLYAHLLERLPPEEAEWLHEEGSRMVSQYLSFQKEAGSYLWTISLLSDETAAILSPVLDRLREVTIENRSFQVQARVCEKIGLEEILSRGRENCGRRMRIVFPASRPGSAGNSKIRTTIF